jgi:histidinol-phosphatase
MDDQLSQRLALARDVGQAAGRHTLKYFQRADLQIDSKQDASPVTIADREAEQLIRQQVASVFPNDGILGEEFDEKRGTSGWRWIVDPIDGTKSFIHGVPLYAVLVGVDFNEESRIGVIDLPALGHTVYAAIGQGAWQDRAGQTRQPIRTSKTKTLSDGVFLTSGISGFHKRGAWSAFERLTKTAKISRTWGDAYGYMLVATGQAEAMVDPQMSIWDSAALLPILQEAGGTFTDWQGRPTIAGGEGIATNGLVLAEVLKLLHE